MSQYVTKIRTNQGDKQIDYNALANLPTTDTTLTESGKAADAKIVGDKIDSVYANFSNPNLLVNSDFRNPVNQRGATSYESKTSGKDVYNIDRWHASYGTITTVNDGSITVAGNVGANRYFYQTFEKRLSGTFTLSFHISDLQGNISMYYDADGGAKTTNIPNGETKMTFTATNLKSVGFLLPKNNGISATISWVKLEIGPVATTFVPRQYAEELMMCKNYFQYINFRCSPGFTSDDGNQISFTSNVIMRAQPSITIQRGDTKLRTSSADVDATLAVSTDSNSTLYEDNILSVNFTHNSSELVAKSVVWPIHDLRIAADAEIY